MKKVLNNFDKIFLIYLYLQPVLDVSSGVLLHFGYEITISSAIRTLFMGLCVIYLTFYVKNKKINLYLLSLSVYFVIFSGITIFSKGFDPLLYEVKNLLTTYYFVILLLTLVMLYKNKTFDVKNLFILYCIYLLFVFIPNILGIGFDSYWQSKEGAVGWFLSANVVGSILSILLPILIIYIKKINFKLIIIFLINLYVILSIGTKVPVLAFIIIISVNVLYYVICLLIKKEYKKISIILIPAVILITSAIIILPKTSFYKNIIIHINYLEEKSNGKIEPETFIDHFIFSQRLTFERNTRKSYKEANLLQKVFGIGYIENYATDNVSFKTIEIDYFDVFYRHGIVGFILFFIPIIYVVISIIKKVKTLNHKNLNLLLSITLIFILALFQGHILVTPANSIYVALILSIVYNNSLKEAC